MTRAPFQPAFIEITGGKKRGGGKLKHIAIRKPSLYNVSMRVKLEKLRRYFQEKRKPLVLTLLPLSLFSLVFLLTPHFAFAGWPFDNISDAIGDYVTGAYLGMAQAAFKGGIWAINASISFTSSFINGPGRLDSWKDVRDLSLSLFGIAVLAIAFMNLLRLQIQVWGVNRMIPKLFLGIFLVIFSKFICISIINFATALANTFMGVGFGDFNKLLDSGGMSIFEDSKVSLMTAFAILNFSIVAFLVFLLLAVILFFRAVVLALLVVVSPLAFALTVLPWTQKYFQEWWKTFLKWTFFFPVCIIILSIGFKLIPGQGTLPDHTPYVAGSPVDPNKTYYCINKPEDDSNPPGCIPKYPSGEEQAQQEKTDSFFAMMVSMFVALVAVVLSVFLPLKMLGAFGAVAQDVLSGKKGIPGARLDPKAIRDWGAARSKKIGARKTDRFSRMMRRPFGEGRLGAAVTGEDALDRAAIRDEKAGLIKKNLTIDQQRILAQNRGDVNAFAGTGHNLSEAQQRWLQGFTSRGGNYEDMIRNLANEGGLNHATATSAPVQDYLNRYMDPNEAYKKSNLHHLRNNLTYPAHWLSPEQLGKMNPADIQRFNATQMAGALQNRDFSNTVINTNKMTDAQKRAVATAFRNTGAQNEATYIETNI